MSLFNLAYPTVLKLEGGYQNSSNDRGNFNSKGVLIGTNHGISAPTLEKYLGRTPTVLDMKNLTKSVALNIYRKYYWDSYSLSFIDNQKLATHIFDLFVNHSYKGAVQIIQKAIVNLKPNSISDFGYFGKITIRLLNELNFDLITNEIIKERKIYYQSLNNSTFINGWLARAESFRNLVTESSTPIAVASTSLATLGFFLF